MFDGQDLLMGSIGLADSAINGEDGVCKKCGKPRPPQELSTETDLLWLECEVCKFWVHAVCVQDILQEQGITSLSEEAIAELKFACCSE